MENKQTAVDWLYDQLIIFPKTNNDLAHNARSFHQAKAMEKEQSRKDYYAGVRDEMQNSGSDFEDYYKQTYANDTTEGLPEKNSKRRGWHY